MIWNERLKIGVKEIDEQHEELFIRFNSLLEIVRNNNIKQERIDKIKETLKFLEEYVIVHFDDEEKLQKSISYPEYESHAAIHEKFKEEVGIFKREFIKSNFDDELIQNFTGKISAWLINHVAADDQKISDYILKKIRKESEIHIDGKLDEILYDASKNVINNMLEINLEKSEVKMFDYVNKLMIEIKIFGDINCEVIYAFSKESALEIVEKMVGMEVAEVDAFVSSAMSELANIISGNFVGSLSEMGKECDITTPEVLLEKKGIDLKKYKNLIANTEKGTISITII